MSTCREHQAEVISLDTGYLPHGPFLLAKPQVWVCFGGQVRKCVCFLLGGSAAAGSKQIPQSSDNRGKLLLPQPFWWSRQQNMLSAAFCLLSIGAGWPANPAGCYSRSSHFLTYLLTTFLTLQASALRKACDQGRNRNPSYYIAWFQSWWHGYLHFSFAFICACLLCLSLALISLRDYKTPTLALPLWIHKLWRFKHFGARFLQTCLFFCMYSLKIQYDSAFSATCKQNWIHIDTEEWIGFYWQILKLTFITSQHSQVNFVHKNRLKTWPR